MSVEVLQSVFVDGALSSFLLPIHSQTAFFALRAFGAEPELLHRAALAGAAGGTLGHMANYGIGRLLLKLSERRKLKIKEDHYEKIAPYYRRLGWVTLLFSWATLFSFFTFTAGIFNIKIRYALPLIALGQLAFYFYAVG